MSWAKHTWKYFIPHSCFLLCWRLFNRKFPVDAVLCRRGFSMASHCSFYKKDSESLRHLFLACPCAKVLWSYIEVNFQISIPTFGSFIDIFLHILSLHISDQTANLLHVAVVSIFSIIWYAWNQFIFQDFLIPVAKVFSMIV